MGPRPRRLTGTDALFPYAARFRPGGAVIILDSITGLARAYNARERGTGRTRSGGLGAATLEKPKRFLGSARAVDPARGGGSLTIIGTALVDTDSKIGRAHG